MADEDAHQGDVILYPYLFLWQHKRGETAGRKDRPVCVALRRKHPLTGETHLILLAVTSREPETNTAAIEVPAIERRRAGLGKYPRAWVIVGEFNYDIVETSHCYDTGVEPLGRFSPSFVAVIARRLVETLRAGRGRIDRNG